MSLLGAIVLLIVGVVLAALTVGVLYWIGVVLAIIGGVAAIVIGVQLLVGRGAHGPRV